jgi:hypothetical protein
MLVANSFTKDEGEEQGEPHPTLERDVDRLTARATPAAATPSTP